MSERMLHGAQIGQSLIDSRDKAIQAGTNAAISAQVVQEQKDLQALFKRIDQGKYTDGTPFSEGYKAMLKAQARAMSGTSWGPGGGYADPSAWAKWQYQLHPGWSSGRG
jgi:hypothetical protein